ncbi:MAG: GDSL-type esterase/lipase family protein [Planctomycetota bacterium]
MKILLCLAMILAASTSELSAFDLEPFRASSIKKWSQEIAALEAKDQRESHPDDSILFVGSSSIRLWDTIAVDMAPYHAIQRGYGGARWTDVAIFADRLITPHKFRAVVFFVANDITGGKDDRTPQAVADLFAHVHSRARAHNPTAPIFYVAVTPTARRIDVWPQIRNGNDHVNQFCENKTDTYFIGTESIYLDGTGQPRTEFFVDDRLHLNREGYHRWSAAIKSHLDSVLGGAK